MTWWFSDSAWSLCLLWGLCPLRQSQPCCQSAAGMAYFCWLTWMLASPWLPWQKAYGIFIFGFWIIAENRLCGKHKFMILYVLFSRIDFLGWIPLLGYLKCNWNCENYPDAPSLNLDYITFFHCSRIQSLCSLENWSVFFFLISLTDNCFFSQSPEFSSQCVCVCGNALTFTIKLSPKFCCWFFMIWRHQILNSS